MKKISFAVAALLAVSPAFADLYLAGDSTMCNYTDRQYPQQGWGQALYKYMKNPDELHNWAIGGRSAKSYKAEGRWQKIVDALKPGDYVIIAFGHNDANKGKKERYSSPADYKELMKGFAADVKAKEATLVFATSIPHSGGISVDAEGKTGVRGSAAGLGPYVAATRELGAELGIEVLDLNDFACQRFVTMGAEQAFKLYMRIKPGEYAAHPNGKGDGCHTRDTGADFFARGAVEMCFARKLPIAALFKEPKDVVFTPIGFDGPGKADKPMKDDFSKEEIAYAGNTDKEASPKYLRLDKDFTPTNVVEGAAVSPFAGKKIAFIGDSYVQNHRRPIPETWHYRLAEKLGMHYYNFGRNGNCIVFANPRRGTPMMKRFGEIPKDVDYMVVVAGHNDACDIAQLGGQHSIPEPTEEQKAEQAKKLAEFKTGVANFITGIKERYPRTTLVFVTPWAVERPFFPEVIATIKEETAKAGVACYDAAALSGINPNDADFRKKYFQGEKDTAHLTFDGHGLMLAKMETFFAGLETRQDAAPARGWSKPMEIGNYDVTLRLGDAEKPTSNFVKFMGRRLASDRINLAAGEFTNFTFTARVPGPYTAKNDGSNLELILSLFTDGKEVAVPEPTVVRNDSAPTIWLCGDSTVTDQKSEPWGSWGQILPAFVKPGWACVNFARSGLAMCTFESDGRLNRILEGMKAGDWVIVQFGHNDQKREGEEPENGYTRRYGEWLAKFQEKGAHLVVVSPCERRRFDEKTGEHQEKTLEGYANAARAFAEKNNLPFIDLNDITYRMHGKLGEKATRPLQVYNKGRFDNTHHTIFGAYVNARIVASELAKVAGISGAIREEAKTYDAMNPVNPKIPASGKTDWKKPEGN